MVGLRNKITLLTVINFNFNLHCKVYGMRYLFIYQSKIPKPGDSKVNFSGIETSFNLLLPVQPLKR